MRTLIQVIAANINVKDIDRARWNIQALNDLLPSGSGIDNGTHVILDDSNSEKIKFSMDFHHMNQDGYYDGWTNHVVTIKPAFKGLNVSVSGKNRNDIKDYLAETLEYALNLPVEETYNKVTECMEYKLIYPHD